MAGHLGNGHGRSRRIELLPQKKMGRRRLQQTAPMIEMGFERLFERFVACPIGHLRQRDSAGEEIETIEASLDTAPLDSAPDLLPLELHQRGLDLVGRAIDVRPLPTKEETDR